MIWNHNPIQAVVLTNTVTLYRVSLITKIYDWKACTLTSLRLPLGHTYYSEKHISDIWSYRRRPTWQADPHPSAHIDYKNVQFNSTTCFLISWLIIWLAKSSPSFYHYSIFHFRIFSIVSMAWSWLRTCDVDIYRPTWHSDSINC